MRLSLSRSRKFAAQKKKNSIHPPDTEQSIANCSNVYHLDRTTVSMSGTGTISKTLADFDGKNPRSTTPSSSTSCTFGVDMVKQLLFL